MGIGYLVVVRKGEAVIDGQQVVEVSRPSAPMSHDKQWRLDLNGRNPGPVDSIFLPPIDRVENAGKRRGQGAERVGEIDFVRAQQVPPIAPGDAAQFDRWSQSCRQLLTPG